MSHSPHVPGGDKGNEQAQPAAYLPSSEVFKARYV